jgi:hypothetical protein
LYLQELSGGVVENLGVALLPYTPGDHDDERVKTLLLLLPEPLPGYRPLVLQAVRFPRCWNIHSHKREASMPHLPSVNASHQHVGALNA